MRDGREQAGVIEAARQHADEELLRLILANASDYAIFTTDPDGLVTAWPAGAQAVFGYAPEEILGRPSALLFTPEDRARGEDRRELETARSAGFAPDERWHLRRDGDRVFMNGSVRPLLEPDGRLRGFLKIAREETEHRRSGEALKNTERRLATVLDNATVAIFQMDDRQQCVYMNAAAEALTGYTFEETRGRALHDVIHHTRPDGRPYPLSECPIDRALPQNNREQGEDVFVHKDGSFYPVAFTASPLRDDDGKPVGTVIEVRGTAEEKAAEAALRESEEHYRHAVELNPQVTWTAAPDGQLDRVSRRWFDWTGASGLGETWAGGLHEDDRQRTFEAWGRSVATGEPYDIEHRVRFLDGRYRWARSRAFPRREADGRIVKWYGTTEDIDERKAAEAQLRAILDSVPVGILMAKAGSGDLVQANRYLETLLRRPVRLGTPDHDGREAYRSDGARLRPEDWPVSRVLATGRPAEEEVRFRKGDGDLGWIRIQAAPVRDDAGELMGAVAGVTDLDEIVQAREVLARSRDELEARVAEAVAERNQVWTLSQDLLAVAGFDGRLKSFNPAWSRLLGYDEQTLLATPFVELIHPDDRAGAAKVVGRLLEGAAVQNFEDRLRKADGGYVHIAWAASPQGDVFYASGRDVTREREQEEQLRQAQKMEAVGQLTGGIAHDFNNLLQIVVGNLELAQRNLPADSARLKRSVDNAMTGARRAATLTERLLAFSRRQPLAPRPVSVNKLVAAMSELLGRSLGEAVEVETVLAGGLWKVEVDPNQLENALVNLAVNARDAMPEGGKLTIETANTRLDESYAQQNLEVAPGQYVVICVSDTGTGMSKEALGRAFEPFFTTKGVGKGTGLGLSQVYGFVKQSGGHVKIYSETGETEGRHRGTTVKIYMPRYLGPGEEGEEPPEDDEAPEGGPEDAILVVEDDHDVRAYTVEVLRELGYRVTEASDGPAALKLLRDAETHCDLLFTDVVLPGGMNGEQLAREAHQARPGLKVLFTTGYARNAVVHHGRLEPGVKLITKPFTYADLAARVRDVLDESPVQEST